MKSIKCENLFSAANKRLSSKADVTSGISDRIEYEMLNFSSALFTSEQNLF